MPKAKYDFSAYATKTNVKCTDGRTILDGCFSHQDGCVVPLVFGHVHDDVHQVLGHGLLEERADGMYLYGSFNKTSAGKDAKEQLQHGDLDSVSIYANRLKQDRNGNVSHGDIKEVSLVLAGANSGAKIDFVDMAHGDDLYGSTAEIYFFDELVLAHSDDDEDEPNVEELQHEDDEDEDDGETIEDWFNGLSEKDQKLVNYLLDEALKKNAGDKVQHDDNDGGNEEMRRHVFDVDTPETTLSHADEMQLQHDMLADMSVFGSLKKSFMAHAEADDTHDEITGITWSPSLAHAAEYGFDDPTGILFPDAKWYNNGAPTTVARDDSWVTKFMSKAKHIPYSKVKERFVDITEDRAKGYVKGDMKVADVLYLMQRETTPCTIYKKQQMDRDDIIDITDFDVVAWIKTEMRRILDEEIAMAALLSDGRVVSDRNKISEQHIRPVWTDDDFFTIKAVVTYPQNATEDDEAKAFIRTAIKSRKTFKGTGTPTLYTTKENLTKMMLMTDSVGRDLYDSVEKLARKLMVAEIVTVEVMENKTRTVTVGGQSKTRTLQGIILNPNDYVFGADKGGSVNMFEDFDLDYNQEKYLIETRCSGALVKPYSALVLETEA